METKCIEVDVRGTSVRIGPFGTTGELLDRWEVKTRKREGGTYTPPDVARSIRVRMEERELSLKMDLVGIGLGVPGPVMPDGFVEICVSPGWRRANPQEELSCLLDGITVKSGNNANMVALGEMWQGGDKGHKDLVMITLGAGVGGGIIIDEKIIADRHGLGGEIDHTHVRDEEQEHCSCGGVGYVEQICSTTNIAGEARRRMRADDKPSALWEYGADITAKDVLDTAKTRDRLVNEAMDMVEHYLGPALSMAVMIADPEIFVVGGGVSKTGQLLIDVIQKHYDYFIPIPEHKGRLELAAPRNDAGIYGAAGLVL